MITKIFLRIGILEGLKYNFENHYSFEVFDEDNTRFVSLLQKIRF